ncbi:MAG: UDP-N-acetylmuramoyl-tripeptide--D-alanyl-D-alanine ligase [Ruminococcaceae bacterium]|nr:UDP-N-acetylmuramoyl-tripeptide--D-alanyl-D-alanine ligase [Oscillospiraceae bacterium]
MKPITVQTVAAAIGGTLLSGNPETCISGICTDTRRIVPDTLFVPIVGERFDAHDFINDALKAGCSATLTSKKEVKSEKPVIYVPDTCHALGALAGYYRRSFSLPLVGITGSVGKTTAKEMTAAVLETKLSVLKTQGNLNNEIGLPLTLFQLEAHHEAAVIEMGMSGFGEIDRLAQIASPDIVIMTNIGLSHIEKLGSQENIYKAKTEFLPHLRPNGKVIINGDDPILWAHRKDFPIGSITVGTSPEHDLSACDITESATDVSFTVVHEGYKQPIRLSFPGAHNVVNALLACAAGLSIGVSLKEAAKALEAFIPGDRRMEFIKQNGLTIINDCYNAAPASMEAGLRVLVAQPGRKIAVLGDIKELGDYAEKAHRDIGSLVAKLSVDALFTLGENGLLIAEAAKEGGMAPDSVFAFSEIEELKHTLKEFTKEGDVILVKASRAMCLERVTACLTA